MNSLPIRVVSAAVALLGLIGIWQTWNISGLRLVCYLAAFGASFEYSKLVFSSRPEARGAFMLLCSIGVITSWFLPKEFLPGLLVALSWLGSCWLIWKNPQRAALDQLLGSLSLFALGTLYCVGSPILTSFILEEPQGSGAFLTFLAMVFFGDTAAFFFGLLLGKKKLYEEISPKKTMMGAVGGLLGSLLAGLCGVLFFELPGGFFIGLSVVIGLLAQSGDLFESLLKRVAKVKDSSQIMPGHGGLLDRLDGVFFAGPFFWLALHFFNWFTH